MKQYTKYSGIVLLLTMLFSFSLIGCPDAGGNGGNGEEDTTPDTEYDIRFGVISDTHIGATGRGAATYPNDLRLNKVLDWYNKQQHLKTLAIVGDITDYGGLDSNWNTVKTSLKNHLGKLRLIAVMGNHDGFPVPVLGQAGFFEQATGQTTNAHHIINGYHFIMLTGGAAGTFDEANLRTPGDTVGDYAAIKDWAIEQIEDAIADDPNKPVFVFFHHPVKNTFYVSDEWYTETFGQGENTIFKDYPQVVVFSGHIHSPNNDPRSIWQGGFTSVNTVTLHYLEMESGYLGDSADGIETSTYPKVGAEAAAQGMIVKVKGSAVIIENYDFDVSELAPTPDVYPLEEQADGDGAENKT
ncbi:hypothetical protein AGMMS4952_25570 [Spirochaetia bacterium]|nr:hypothetical protein AGMMS4952_25570 [Spirochaetia bacterium]